ncbi:MFS transporter [Cohnella hashimotonis]|uniref:MFS transporter n=1 Tax=Cohnella hashimotonis TaxID=2826895 RepID=A0ABT6T975_9BACL|nr:MFS transporter [Cohnella hashimotonis]MDI4643334.1 MFS transporter [Cohnella hashimotonis]
MNAIKAGNGAAANTENTAFKSEKVATLILGLAMVLVIMNTMMFNLALPDVTHDFALSPSSASWIVTGYSIVFAISSITYSRLSDYVPIRRLVVISLLLFGLAAIIGLFANSFLMLLIVRIVQATGAGAIPSLSLVLISRYVPIERRGAAMAIIMSAASLGLGLGPVVGGAVVQYLGWHLLFAVSALTLILVPVLAIVLPSERKGAGSLDLPGALLAAVSTTGLLLFLTNHQWYMLAGGALALILFAARIRTARFPFVLPALFANRRYLLLGAVGVAAYLSSFATLFLLPQILVHLHGLSAIESGLVIFPGSLLALLMSRKVGGLIDRSGNAAIIRYIPVLILLSVVLFALLSGTSYVSILLIYMLLSLGFTFMTSSISNEMSRLLPASQIGSGMGLFQLLQFVSGAFGVALSASAIDWQKRLPLREAYSNIYWGLAVVVLLSIGCAYLYLRDRSAKPVLAPAVQADRP